MIISYSEDFKDKDYVEAIVSNWKNGSEFFELRTSGTTAQEKIIRLPRTLLEWSVKQTADAFNLESEKVLCCLPVHKTAGFMQLVRALYHKWDIHFIQPSGSPLKDIGVNHAFTTVSMSPQQIANCVDYSGAKLSRFTTVLIGGVAINHSLEAELLAWSDQHPFCELYLTYGSAETASHIAFRRLGEKQYQCLDGVKVSAINNCLHIEIPSLSFNHTTKDLAELSGSGFKILGRSDHVINSGGIKIQLEQTQELIEEVFHMAGLERNFYLSSAPDKLLGQKLILVIEGEAISDEKFLYQLLKRELPPHHSPREIAYLSEFDFTDTGKLKRVLPFN